MTGPTVLISLKMVRLISWAIFLTPMNVHRRCFFPDEPMGEEKYILYADLSDTDIGTSDFKSMDGKRVGVLMGTESEIMLTEWENKNGIHTEHVNVNNDDDVEKEISES